MKMDFDTFTDRLVQLVREADEAWPDHQFNDRYEAVVAEAIASGWSQQELWDESGRRLSASLAQAIKEIEEEQNAAQST
jgi:hypothetical protein